MRQGLRVMAPSARRALKAIRALRVIRARKATLARKVIRESEGCLAWMIDQGIRFQPSLFGTLSPSRCSVPA